MGFGMDGTYWLSGVPKLSNFYVPVWGSISGDDPNPKVNELVERFKKQFGKPPTTSGILMGYDTIMAFKTAAERAGTIETQAVLAELEKFRDEPMLTGPRTFTKDNHIQRKARGLMMQIQNGKRSSLGYYTNEKAVPLSWLK